MGGGEAVWNLDGNNSHHPFYPLLLLLFFFFFTPTTTTSRAAALIDHFVSLIAAPNPPTLCVDVRMKTTAIWIKSISGLVEDVEEEEETRGEGVEGDNNKKKI